MKHKISQCSCNTDSAWTTEMTINTAQSAATAINSITTDNTAALTITTDQSNYIDYSHYNSIKSSWQWDGSSWDGNSYLNNYIYNPQYFVVPNIYNIPSHIVLTEGSIVYATDTNTLYIYRYGRFEPISPVQSTYTVSSGYTTTNTSNNKQKKLVEENNLIMLYFF